MKFGLKYMRDGREVSPEEWTRGLMEQAVERAAESVRERVSSLRCREHGESPTVEVHSANGKTGLQVQSCCAALHAEAQALLTDLGAKPKSESEDGHNEASD